MKLRSGTECCMRCRTGSIGHPEILRPSMPFEYDVQKYYQLSDDELAQRYIKDKEFLSREYCEAALEHRYGLYPFLRNFADFSAWTGKRVLEVGCGQGADLSQFAAAGAATFGCDLTKK